MSRRILLLALVALLPEYGCAKSAGEPQPAADAQSVADSAKEEVAAQQSPPVDPAQEQLLKEATAAVRLADELSGKPSTKPTGKLSERAKPSAQTPAMPAATARGDRQPRERFVIFTPQGPLICELVLTIDGQPHTVALDRLVDDALATAKSEQGATPLWSKLVASPRFRYGQFGNEGIKDEEERQRAISRYDLNRDDVVDRGEMRRFLTRNQAGGGSLIVHAEDPNRDQSVLAGPAWQLLDEDSDQVLSAEEMHNAAERLRTRDGRDDESLAPDELAASGEASSREPMRRLASYLSVARTLSDDTSWADLASAIDELYPEDQRATQGNSAWTAGFFAQLDADGDGSLDADELAALVARPPDLRIDARLGSDSRLALLKLIGMGYLVQSLATMHVDVPTGAAVPIKVEASGDGVQLSMPRLAIDLSRSDAVDALESIDKSADAQFKQFDQDANGYLDRNEFRATGQPAGAFDTLDANSSAGGSPTSGRGETADGKVYPDAWRTFLRRQRVASASLVHAYIGSVPDPLFMALDVDHDGRLGAREMAGAAARLLTLDANGDQRLSADELPQRMTIQLVRDTQPPERGMPPRMPSPRRDVVRTGPDWFQRMDANADGDVSPREFLGTQRRFQELDRNGDGFVDASEAIQVDVRDSN